MKAGKIFAALYGVFRVGSQEISANRKIIFITAPMVLFTTTEAVNLPHRNLPTRFPIIAILSPVLPQVWPARGGWRHRVHCPRRTKT